MDGHTAGSLDQQPNTVTVNLAYPYPNVTDDHDVSHLERDGQVAQVISLGLCSNQFGTPWIRIWQPRHTLTSSQQNSWPRWA